MIRIRVELVPGGIDQCAEELGTAEIANDLRESMETEGMMGSYKVKLFKWGKGRRLWKSGSVSGFNRKSRGPWDLLFLALLDTVGERNKKHIEDAFREW